MSNGVKPENQSERRRHKRKSLNYYSKVACDGQSPHSALIKDFSESGLLISYSDARHLLSQEEITPGNEVDVGFDVATPKGIAHYQLRATIARAVDRGVGLQLVDPDPATIRVLEAISKHGIRGNRRTHRKNGKISPTDFIQVCKDDLTQFLEPVIIQFFRMIRDRFLELGSRASSNVEQSNYMDARELIENNRKSLEKDILNNIVKQVDNLAAREVQTSKTHSDDFSVLSIIEKDIFDDWLVIRVISTKAESRFNHELFEVNQRMSYIFRQEITTKNNPIAPTYICEAFQKSAKTIQISRNSERALYEVFEKAIISHLGVFYEAINKHLIDRGVLPVLKHVVNPIEEPVKSENNAINTDQTSDAALPIPKKPLTKSSTTEDNHKKFTEIRQGVSNNSSSIPSQHAVKKVQHVTELDTYHRPIISSAAKTAYSYLSNLLNSTQAKKSRIHSCSDKPQNVPRLPDKELIERLNYIQRQSDVNDHSTLKEKISHILSDDLTPYNVDSIDDNQIQLIKIADDLIQSITHSSQISNLVIPHIKRLEAPILKIIMQDGQFFSNENHPAKKLLEHVARLGAKGTCINRKTQASIEETVNYIVTHFEGDLKVFEEALATLDTLVNKQNAIYKKNIDRLRQVCEGQQKTDKARLAVLEAINQRVTGKPIPKLAYDVIKIGWKNLLLLTSIREGTQSKNWTLNLQILDRLLEMNSVTAKKIKVDLFMEVLKRGLIQACGGQFKYQNLLDEIEKILRAQESGQYPLDVELITVDPDVDEKPVTPQFRSVIKSDAGSTFVIGDMNKNIDKRIIKIKRLKVGDWLEMKSQEGTNERVRLAWIGNEFSKFVFINHQGMKVIDLSIQELTTFIDSGRAKRIYDADESIVNVALDDMVRHIYENLSHEATHDELTGLLNQNEFARRVERSIAFSQGKKLKHVVCFVDIHQFKLLNKTYGYDKSDLFLKSFGLRLKRFVNDSLTAHCSRQGNSSFAILLEDTSSETAYRQLTEFLQDLSNNPINIQKGDIPVNLNIGIFPLIHHHTTAGKAIKGAESACDKAKTAGLDRIEVFEEKDEIESDPAMSWVAHIQSQLDHSKIHLCSQKIAPLQESSQWTHSEILMAVVNDKGEEQPPGSFIQAAEEHKKMTIVDKWVISEIFRWISNNPKALEELGGLSINLSGHSINDESFTEFLFEIFKETKVPMSKICFEITETTAIVNISEAADFINELRDYGCHFSLDDFGSGLSSYTYLKNLNVDFIKIDKSFIKSLHEDTNDIAMVKSIKEMGHYMGKQVIAEGVENEETYQLLKEIGIDYVQGYHIQKPTALPLA